MSVLSNEQDKGILGNKDLHFRKKQNAKTTRKIRNFKKVKKRKQFFFASPVVLSYEQDKGMLCN